MSRTHETLTELFTDIADSIREKTGSTESIVADNFPDEITNIPSGGEDLETEEYMRISDLLEYPKTPNENDYTENEIAKVDALIEFYDEMEDDTDGE